MPITERIDGDVDFLDLHELYPKRYPYLLQTVARQQSQQVEYDILFACPQHRLVLDGDGRLSTDKALPVDSGLLSASGLVSADPTEYHHSNFLTAFDEAWRSEKTACDAAVDLPFLGGWFIFLSYELAGQVEPSLALPRCSAEDLPIAFATRIPAAIIKNHHSNEIHIVVEHQSAASCLPLMVDDVRQCQARAANKVISTVFEIPVVDDILEENANRYLRSVRQIKRYIKNGDVFQVNLSRLWQARLTARVSAADLYRRLRISNPAPFFALATYNQHAIVSSSPERLVRVSNQRIQTRPIAGTRPRGNSSAEDIHNRNELLAHPKERAEHIMLIDLERNDIGRVCVPGTVEVNELMVLESYAHVHHIVSNIQGQLAVNTSPSEIIRAVFPGGTITGCPKVRCMEILTELEQSPRGAYTGSLGYINHDGSMDLNILIRTLVKNQNAVSFRAGGGIVTDSMAEKELQETRVKAKGLLLALGVKVG
ncbi:MAG: aminodeoxychorismate synthase component I [Gammaproteobacteria bacterium]|nr:aminodeoxychorismate synthase component I [Gammaproteobacteria bacterium]